MRFTIRPTAPDGAEGRPPVVSLGQAVGTSSVQRPTVAVLIPARDEERLIGGTLESLQTQTWIPDRILVVADNCTDRTVEIARSFGVEVMETIANTAKKAGALNQGYTRVSDAEVLIQIDSDIVVDSAFVAEMVSALYSDNRAGAVTARVGVQAFPGGSPLRRLLWRLQRLEYYYYDSIKIEDRGRVWCISGIGGAYRGDLLRQLSAGHPGPWSLDSIVEDYTLSVEIEEAGWLTGTAMNAFAWSDTMESARALWAQRRRWNAGTFREWQRRDPSPVMDADKRTFRRGMLLATINPLIVVGFLVLWAGGAVRLGWLSLAISSVFIADRLWRLRYVPNRTVSDWVLAAVVLPELIYRVVLDINLFTTRLKTLTKRGASLEW